jgi:NAD(P)H-dependent FMN reductase
MSRLMIIIGSVRPGRVGLPVAEWVAATAREHGGWDEVDVVDLIEQALPWMDEPNHPRLGQYTQAHTIAWSERVKAADAVIFVTPEYNYSYSPALKNAIDYLNAEWWRKPYGMVSYGGVSAGTRGAAALSIPLTALGMVRVGANVEINFPGASVSDGVYSPGEKEAAILQRELGELAELSPALAALRAAHADA